MKVSLASALGTCFGVKDAINLALEPEFKGELTIVGQLVHNRQVNESLKKNGVSVVDGTDAINQIKTKKVMITAHGAADKMKKQLTEAGFNEGKHQQIKKARHGQPAQHGGQHGDLGGRARIRNIV